MRGRGRWRRCTVNGPNVTVRVHNPHRQVSKESVLEKDVSGRLPLHIAFQNGAPIELIDLLLKNNHPVCLPPAVASG